MGFLERTWKSLNEWLYGLADEDAKAQKHGSSGHAWWKVMCLTGVDYFSTLGYQPGIAFIAAAALSPIATIFLVFMTLFGALPVYKRVAGESPHGEGSISMLERLMKGWGAKTIVLVLLGFAATDFIITITLSASDAAVHMVHNPFLGEIFKDRVIATLLMVTVLAAVFYRGFKEAIGIAVVLVSVYLSLNLVIVTVGLYQVFSHPTLLKNWVFVLHHGYPNPMDLCLMSIFLFPRLALGLSGFETGVAVMPSIQGDPDDSEEKPAGRIRRTGYMLTTAAGIMSFFLLASSLVTTLLIPAKEFNPGGAADGRALAYLAHYYLGDVFGTILDTSSIFILWFAGASAMAGLLSLVPRYLPKYGMAPDWAQSHRPLVIFFALVAFVVVILFDADVDKQGAAYATGVLVLMTSAAFAVTLSVWDQGWKRKLAYSAITLMFAYTTIANIFERPAGLKIACFFIGTTILVSLLSRTFRSYELRIRDVIFDDTAMGFIERASKDALRLIASAPGGSSYEKKEETARLSHNLTEGDVIFLEVSVADASKFSAKTLHVVGVHKGRHKILRCTSLAVPNAIAALLLEIRNKTGTIPHIFFGWAELHPFISFFRFLFLGEGDTAPVTEEVLREAEPDPEKRPRVHVG